MTSYQEFKATLSQSSVEVPPGLFIGVLYMNQSMLIDA